MRSIFILFIMLFLTSCAQNAEEKTTEAIDVALSHLSKGDCEDAIKVLGEAGMQNNNAVYLQVLASAYACKAQYNEIAFIADDLSAITTTNGFTIFKSFATLTLSEESEADSDNYVAIRTGINYLLNSTTTIGQNARETKFGPRKGLDMGVQALLLNVVNLGKFLNYYGNVSSAGVKGGGTSHTNHCFINYTDSDAQGIIALLPTANQCNSNTDGHPDLTPITSAASKRRLCEGLMTITNIMDIVNNLDLSGSSELDALEDIATQINTYKSTLESTRTGTRTLINTLSQSNCEELMDTSSYRNDMELLYAILFEAALQ